MGWLQVGGRTLPSWAVACQQQHPGLGQTSGLATCGAPGLVHAAGPSNSLSLRPLCPPAPLRHRHTVWVLQVQRSISAADALADATGAQLGRSGSGKSPAKPAALDWDLQHTAFLTMRVSGAATGGDAISRSSFVGVGSADAVGARHALALVADVAYRVGAGRGREGCAGRVEGQVAVLGGRARSRECVLLVAQSRVPTRESAGLQEVPGLLVGNACPVPWGILRQHPLLLKDSAGGVQGRPCEQDKGPQRPPLLLSWCLRGPPAGRWLRGSGDGCAGGPGRQAV